MGNKSKSKFINNTPNQLSLTQKDTRAAWGLVLPAFIFVIAILAFPIFWSVTLSFTDKVVGAEAHFLGLDNYIKLLTDVSFRKSLLITLTFTVLAMAFKTIFGVILALLMNMEFKGRDLVRAVLIIPWALPNVVSVLNWKWIFSTNGGAVNQILTALGIIDKNIAWTSTTALAMFVIVFINVWRGSPFIGISVLSKLQTIDTSYYEAAQLDGANVFQRFWHITLPGIADSLKVAVLVSTIWTVNEFELVWIVTGGGPSRGTELLSIFSYNTVLQNRAIGLAAAVPIVLMPLLIFLMTRISKLSDDSI